MHPPCWCTTSSGRAELLCDSVEVAEATLCATDTAATSCHAMCCDTMLAVVRCSGVEAEEAYAAAL